jgi:excisionase family DNA binding protein
MIEIRPSRLASLLGVHRNTVRNWIRSGKLAAKPGVGKRYVISRSELAEFLRARQVSAGVIQELTDRQSGASAGAGKTRYQKPDIDREVPMSDKPVGSVMVVGGGIAGIQSALDLAESGYFVYLLEKSPGIGGNMARLDKTFPTNDCAM